MKGHNGDGQRSYSLGRIGPDDEGDTGVAILADPARKLVVMDFRDPVTWLAMDPAQAVAVASALIEKAQAIAEGPLTFTIAGSPVVVAKLARPKDGPSDAGR